MHVNMNTAGSLPLQSLDERLAALERGAATADLATATMRLRVEMSTMLDRVTAVESQVNTPHTGGLAARGRGDGTTDQNACSF